MKKTAITLLILAMLLCSVSAANAEFKDIKDSGWFAEAVGKLSVMDIINGMADGSFNPQGEVTRAQFVKMLVLAMEYKKIDSLSFEDLKPFKTSKPHWASVYIETALRNSVIVKSELGDNFYPDVPLTRKDMAMMIFMALELEPSSGVNPFADLAEANSYFTRLYEEYLIRGTIKGGKRLFNPETLSTRAEAAVIIARMIDYKADPIKFKDTAAMEERFSNGTQTAEDIAAKRAAEIAKAKADPNYIMETIITVEINEDNKKYRWFELYFENMADYSDDSKWELEVVNYKQLNTYEMPRPDGTFVKDTITGWRSLGSKFNNRTRASCFVLGTDYYTTQALIKNFKLYPGMDIKFKITVKKGLKERVIYKTVKLQ